MKYLDELQKLGLPANDFAVFGSGPLAVRGLIENSDIDLIVRTSLWTELATKHPVIDGKEIKIGHVSIFYDWLPWFDDNNDLIDTADIFDGIRFVNFEKIKQWKTAMGRDKDQEHLKLIENYLSEQK